LLRSSNGLEVIANHSKAEWGQVLFGRVLVSAVDENGRHQTTELGFGDIWYFPKGQAHTVQGLDDENEYLLAFDDGNFDQAGSVALSVDN
jgi:oxalate decarboxylase